MTAQQLAITTASIILILAVCAYVALELAERRRRANQFEAATVIREYTRAVKDRDRWRTQAIALNRQLNDLVNDPLWARPPARRPIPPADTTIRPPSILDQVTR